MSTEQKVEIFFNLIRDITIKEENKIKKLQTLSNNIIKMEKELYKGLTKTKIGEYLKLEAEVANYYNELVDHALKYAIKFLLNFYSL